MAVCDGFAKKNHTTTRTTKPTTHTSNPEIAKHHAPSPDKGRAGEGISAAQIARTSNPSRKVIPYDQKLIALARANRQNPTPAENAFWQHLARHKQFAGYRFQRQKPIGHYIVDFYCAALGLVIEIDGDSHASQQQYDRARSDFLASQCLKTIRYQNADVMQNLAGVFDDICQQTSNLIRH